MLKRFSMLVPILCLLSTCQVEEPVVSNPVTWFVVNGWQADVEFQIFDKVCNRRLRNVALERGEEIQVTTCGNARNQAEIRYRRDGSYATPWSHGVASRGQRLQML